MTITEWVAENDEGQWLCHTVLLKKNRKKLAETP